MIDDLGRFVKSLSLAERVWFALGGFVLTFVVSLVTVAVVIVWLPATYFREDYVSPLAAQHPIVRWAGVIIKNVVGVVVVFVGLLLSLPGIPGQGLLTILIGVMLVDFPGKRRLERRLVLRPSVLAVINTLRARFGKPPLVFR